jgi:chromosomal replication initiator protein
VHTSVEEAIRRSGLNEKYSLQNFVVGNSNRIAHAAAQAVINSPGSVYNPLFIHGKTGVGKTHLAQAIGRALLERSPAKKVAYTSSEGFLNDMVKAIRTHKQIEFRNRYRAVSMLIIDDIQLISKWVETQNEFFNTFNELYNNNSHVILISDRAPEEIKDLEARLRSRFQGGLVADINRPELELRLAILEKKSSQSGFEVSRTILETIARNVEDNIRELEGALQKVALFDQMKPAGLSMEEVLKIIGSDIKSKRERVKVSAVIKQVAKRFGVSLKDIKGPRRTKDVALARQVAMYILREEFDYNLEEVAQFLNRSDHTTVMHAVDKIKSIMLTTEGFKAQIVEIIKILTEHTDLDD